LFEIKYYNGIIYSGKVILLLWQLDGTFSGPHAILPDKREAENYESGGVSSGLE